MASRREPGKRVFWSDAEKNAIVLKAADIQAERPDLSGLPLIRAALKCLPSERRRKLISLSQVPWFEPWLTEEIKKRLAESQALDSLLPMLEAHADLHKAWIVKHEKWHKDEIHLLGSMVKLLEQIRESLARNPRKQGT